jgi:hypothetical protein
MQIDMRLNTKAFASAASITAALVFTGCAVLVALSPQFATGLLSDAIHVDLSGLTRTLTWTTYFEGLVFWMITAGVVFGVAAQLYNALAVDRASSTEIVGGRTQASDRTAPLLH